MCKSRIRLIEAEWPRNTGSQSELVICDFFGNSIPRFHYSRNSFLKIYFVKYVFG